MKAHLVILDMEKPSKCISGRLLKFLYCLDNKQWYLTFTYLFFQIHFSTDSLFFSILFKYYFFIYSLFIIYSFFNNYTSSNIFLFNTWLL